MSNYTVSKISVNTRNMDGSDIHEYSKHFDTWAQLTRDMHQRDRHANEMFYGKGSVIERDGEVIGNITDFYHHERSINRVSLADFIATNENWNGEAL